MKKKLKIKLRGKILGIFISILMLLSIIILLVVNNEIRNLEFKDIDNVIPKVKSVNDSILIINEDKNIIIDKIESSSSVAEEISEYSQQIAAASEELSASSEEVTATAHILNSMTKKIVNIASKFEL